MNSRKVYMDYNATTPLHPMVKEEIISGFEFFGNPSSMHEVGRQAKERIEKARELTADFIGAQPNEVIFTGGGSESNNTVLNITACSDSFCRGCEKGRHEVITTAVEHPSVLNTVNHFKQTGIPVHILKVDSTGKVDITQLREALTEKTALVSVIMANNEIGTINDIKSISKIVHEKGALMHADAVQALGKIPVNVRDLEVDYLSFSAHKIYGPKGIGGLYAKNRNPYCPLILGGHQENGRRAGTQNTIGIIGLGKAIEMAKLEIEERTKILLKLRTQLKTGIENLIPEIHINGNQEDFLPNTLNVSFRGAEGEAILLYLDLDGIAVSTGSACASGSLDPSHVLLATKTDLELAHGSIRFSLGRESTKEDVDYVLEKLPPIIKRIRSMSTIKLKGEMQEKTKETTK